MAEGLRETWERSDKNMDVLMVIEIYYAWFLLEIFSIIYFIEHTRAPVHLDL